MRLLVAGGGTGGHLFPGIAVAEAVLGTEAGSEALFVGTSRGLEAREIPARGMRLHLIDVQPLKGKGVRGALKGLASVPRAVLQVRRILADEKPDVVLGVGGYASGPAVLAACLEGIPSALLEQNAVPGLTNRMCGPLVRKAFVTFPESVSRFPHGKAVVSGNPVRQAFLEAAGRPEPADGSVVVFGGSLGARTLNRVVPEALKLAQVERAIVHQTGQAEHGAVLDRYRELGLAADVRPFLDDIALQLERASLVICRAGATTLAELCAVGRASILIPFPFATDDHQTYNAASLQAGGCSIMLSDREVTPDALAVVVRELLSDPDRRRRMAGAARERGRPDAAVRIARELCSSAFRRAPCAGMKEASHV